MLDAPLFPATYPPAAEVEADLTGLGGALQAAEGGGPSAKAALDVAADNKRCYEGQSSRDYKGKLEMKQALTQDSDYLREVREQYEQYPYPARDPKKEKQFFRCVRPCALDCLNYYHYSGRRDFTKGFRALVAGGGTGDAVITLAEQFRGLDAEIVQIDLSSSSLQVAQERAKVRGLSNITWVQGSLLDAPELFSEPFDLIECSGVLHHLENPEAGLAALARLLKDDGVMSLMLYAKYGRAAIYQIQELMRIVNKDEPNMQHKVNHCKTVLGHIPPSNPIRDMLNIFNDVKEYGDVGIYDLFLHSHDRAYSVPDVYQFLASAGLVPTHFFFERDAMGNDTYKLEAYFRDGSLSDSIKSMSLQEKQAAAELMHGRIVKHMFYAAKHTPPLPSIDDLDNVPFYYMLADASSYQSVSQSLGKAKIGEPFKTKIFGYEVDYNNTPHLARIWKYMDGQKSLEEIFQAVRLSYAPDEKKPEMEELLAEFKMLFTAFNKQDLLLLRHKSAPLTVRASEIHKRMTSLK